MTNGYLPVYKPGTKELLCRYDPVRRMLEIQDRRIKYWIDLTEYELPAPLPEHAEPTN